MRACQCLCLAVVSAVISSHEGLSQTLVRQTIPQSLSRLEYRIDGLPSFQNPFDPEQVAIDATVTAPSGNVRKVPAFWYQAYQRTLSNGSEVLAKAGSPEWRLRLTPTETGTHQVVLTVTTNGQPSSLSARDEVEVQPAAVNAKPGFARLSTNQVFFETADGRPLPFIGECVCWHGAKGTYDYDQWFPAMAAAGGNWARLWMWPNAFGLEADSNTLTNYRLDRAWQLDYVVGLAEQQGIHLMLCLDYHGMYEVEPDYWGGNNYWPKNPYNAAQGGPCANQNAFFTSAAAQKLYQKRLRYLVARYGYSPQLFAWEFFNEIDNEARYLNMTNVATWHGVMGDWLRANDPYRHLITTSMTGGSDQPLIWKLPQMDFANYHSYNQVEPTTALAKLVPSFVSRYQKPVLVSEFGVDWRGWVPEADPYLRGWRQHFWSIALSGSAGTGMSWWWERIHDENIYPLFQAFAGFAQQTGWGRGGWTPAVFLTSGEPPTRVGDLVTDGTPFAARVNLSQAWGAKQKGQAAITSPLSAQAASSALNAFVHGTGHPELKIPFKLDAWLGTNATLTLHVNSVSDGAIMAVLVDGKEVYRKSLPNKDGTYQVNNEYNEDFVVSLPAGKHLIDVVNRGGDWFCLDWVRLDPVQPSTYANGWRPSPASAGMVSDREMLLYTVNPEVNYPANATNATVNPMINQTVVVTNVASGKYLALWFDPATGKRAGETTGAATNQVLTLPVPPVKEDLAAVVRRVGEFGLVEPQVDTGGTFRVRLSGEDQARYAIESSVDLASWDLAGAASNLTAGAWLAETNALTLERGFYRARRTE